MSLIAGKTHDEILSMEQSTRSRWYNRILPEEREEAMRVVGVVGRAKLSASLTGKTRTEESKAKQSASMMGHLISEETRAKISVSNTGKSHTEKTKAKLSTSWTPKRKAKYCGENHHSKKPEVKAKISASHIGITPSEETKAKQSVSATERWKDPKERAKVSGKNSSNWQGGVSFEPYGVEFNGQLKTQIRERDNHTCQECQQSEGQLGYALHIHHIDYDKKNNSSDNLISLCRSCHAQTGFGREDWTEYFQEIMENNKT